MPHITVSGLVQYCQVMFTIDFECIITSWTPIPIYLNLNDKGLTRCVIGLRNDYGAVKLVVVIFVGKFNCVVIFNVKIDEWVFIEGAR